MYSFKMVLLMIALALGIAHCAPNHYYQEDWRDLNTDHRHMDKLPSKCIEPDWDSCNGTYNKFNSENSTILRWYFDPIFKACYPVYKLPNKTIDSSILNFSKTRRECEDTCGYPCLIKMEDGSSERGVCMDFSKCHIPVINPSAHLPYPMSTYGLPCPPYDIPCCPRDYEIPTAS